MRKAEVAVAICIFAVSGLVFYASREYPLADLGKGGAAALFPCLLAGAFAVVAVLLLLGSIVGSYSREKTSSFILPEKRSLLSVVVILLLLLATPYIMGFLGFLLTAFFFLAVLLLRLRDKPLTIRSALTTILLSAGVTGVVYAVFWWGAKVPLPVGVLLGA